MGSSLSENMKQRIATIKESLKAPFGTWPMDKKYEEIGSGMQYLKSTSLCAVGIFDEKYVYKMYPDFNVPPGYESELGGDTATLRTRGLQRFQHELLMTKLAGDCAVSTLGRVFDRAGDVCGFIMPLEKVLIAPPFLSAAATISPEYSQADRKSMITQLISLVDELQKKEVIHGDINPTNMLLCSDGKLRLCDFQSSFPVGTGRLMAFTIQYLSPTRNRAHLSGEFPLLSFADDLYATGVSIWEIYTGCAPFDDVPPEPEEMLEDVIAAGIRPDVSKIDDEETRALALSHLDRGCGDESLVGGVIRPAKETCILTDVEFKDCLADPPHTYSHLVQCASCTGNASPESSCPNLYKAAGVTKLAEPRRCCTLCK